MTKKIIIVDLFAGTFSVTKSILEIQKENPDFEIIAIFCLELSKKLCLDFLKSDYYQKNLKNQNIHFKIYQANILNENAKKKLFNDINSFVSSYASKNESFGIFILSGPPCNNYSNFHYLNGERINGEKFEKKQLLSDSLVETTLKIYVYLKNLYNNFYVDLLIENPWSNDILNLYHEDDPFNLQGIKHSFNLSLRTRPFFQDYLIENGGYLFTSKHFWCYYDYENFSKKPTAIFSTLSTIKSNKCMHKKHKNTIIGFENAAIRGRWPKQFVKYVFECFLNRKKDCF